MPESPTKTLKWHHPSEVMKLHKLKQKKKALQARIKGQKQDQSTTKDTSRFDNVFSAKKRRNPFLKQEDESKRSKLSAGTVLDESADQTLFKLFNQSASSSSSSLLSSFTSFSNVFNFKGDEGHVEVVKAQGKKWLPVDWALKNKMRLLSASSFQWNQKLKISEEASGITAFTRCLGPQSTETTLDTSPNAKFHQCCLYWQQPVLPWLPLFPRCNSRSSNGSPSLALNASMRNSFQHAWSDSLRSLFQLIRTGQCPYFYACANSFTVLFRAAGICGFGDVHAVVTPTSRGFRQLLKQEDIEFTMPLKKKRDSDQGYETLDSVINDEAEQEDAADENWMKSFGINEQDIKQINYTQDKIEHKAECDVDNSEQSLILIEGVEVNSLYNFLINCKSATAITGPFAGIPPTLLAPVAFHGASLNSLKVRQNKVHTDNNEDYFSLELSGPILPTMIHNLFAISTVEQSLTASFSSIKSTEAFSKLKAKNLDNVKDGGVVFRKENLSGCGLLPVVLQRFCEPDDDHVANVDCLKYSNERQEHVLQYVDQLGLQGGVRDLLAHLQDLDYRLLRPQDPQLYYRLVVLQLRPFRAQLQPSN